MIRSTDFKNYQLIYGNFSDHLEVLSLLSFDSAVPVLFSLPVAIFPFLISLYSSFRQPSEDYGHQQPFPYFPNGLSFPIQAVHGVQCQPTTTRQTFYQYFSHYLLFIFSNEADRPGIIFVMPDTTFYVHGRDDPLLSKMLSQNYQQFAAGLDQAYNMLILSSSLQLSYTIVILLHIDFMLAYRIQLQNIDNVQNYVTDSNQQQIVDKNYKMDQVGEVVKYILYRCRQNNTPLTQIMAFFIVQTIYNPKTSRFYLQDKLSESEMRELKDAALKKVLARDSQEMRIIDMQITYDTQFLDMEKQKQSKANQDALATGQKIDQVVNYQVKNAKDFEGLTQLYKKIFNFLLHKNKQITQKTQYAQNQFKIQKQVAAALESVIPRAALGPFVTLNSSQKVTQLVELSNLVIGIRLFNQQISKGGAGLTPITNILNFQSRTVRDLAYKQLQDITEQGQRYTAVFKAQQYGVLKLQPTQFKRLKNQMTFIRQYKSFMINLEEEIQISENTLQTNELKYLKQIQDLRVLLGAKSSAPKQQVYPRFAILAQSYIAIYEERKSAEQKIRLFQILKQYRKIFPLSLSVKLFNKAIEQLKAVQQRKKSEKIQEDPNSGVQIFMPSTSPDFMQKPCDYVGYCIWSIVKKNGLLIPGQPDFGVYRYKQKNCVFSSVEAINDFLKQPQYYVTQVIQQCRKNPELILFLRLEDTFKNVKLSLVNQAVQGNLNNRLMLDKGVDTPTHFVQKNLDPNYYWNEWQLRKKAIQMANIRKTQTRGDQTILSNFRVDSDTQTFLKKDAETNTMGNVGTQFKAEKNI